MGEELGSTIKKKKKEFVRKNEKKLNINVEGYVVEKC